MDPEPVHLSVVIPAHNEQAYLPRLLDTVDAARDRYHRGGHRIEVVVADNASMRKFDQHGDWHYFPLIFRLLPLMFGSPSATNDLVQRYWYGDGREPPN
jgi:cellulose synthase/poly-beta-1,6-N-acetylglucosamine synthase-like glycosyltransferase